MMNKTKFKKYDIVDHLQNQADIDSYLEAAFADGDLQVITRALGDVARAKGMTSVAKSTNIDRTHLYRALSNDGDPRLSTLSSVMNSFGYQLSFTSKKKIALHK